MDEVMNKFGTIIFSTEIKFEGVFVNAYKLRDLQKTGISYSIPAK